MEKEQKTNVLAVEIRVIAREVKSGSEKGKKFFAYQIYNKAKGYYEELRFNKAVTNQPKEEGSFILEVERKEINRLGLSNRKYPLTWISKIESVSKMDNGSKIEGLEEVDELPF